MDTTKLSIAEKLKEQQRQVANATGDLKRKKKLFNSLKLEDMNEKLHSCKQNWQMGLITTLEYLSQIKDIYDETRTGIYDGVAQEEQKEAEKKSTKFS